jgi:hypothetical protein
MRRSRLRLEHTLERWKRQPKTVKMRGDAHDRTIDHANRGCRRFILFIGSTTLLGIPRHPVRLPDRRRRARPGGRHVDDAWS